MASSEVGPANRAESNEALSSSRTVPFIRTMYEYIVCPTVTELSRWSFVISEFATEQKWQRWYEALCEYMDVDRYLLPIQRENNRLELCTQEQRRKVREQIEILQNTRNERIQHRHARNELLRAKARPSLEEYEREAIKKIVCTELKNKLTRVEEDVRGVLREEVQHYAYRSRFVHTLQLALHGLRLSRAQQEPDISTADKPDQRGITHPATALRALEYSLRDIGWSETLRDILKPLHISVAANEGISPQERCTHLATTMPQILHQYQTSSERKIHAIVSQYEAEKDRGRKKDEFVHAEEGYTSEPVPRVSPSFTGTFLLGLRNALLIDPATSNLWNKKKDFWPSALGGAHFPTKPDSQPVTSWLRIERALRIRCAPQDALTELQRSCNDHNETFQLALLDQPEATQKEYRRWVDNLICTAAIDQSLRVLDAFVQLQRYSMLGFIVDVAKQESTESATNS